MRGSSVHFKINEYGVYEVMSNAEFYKCKEPPTCDEHLKLPLAQRSNRKPSQRNKPHYLCEACGESGHAEDFLQPEVCSWECREKASQQVGVKAETVEDDDLDRMTPSPFYSDDEEDDDDEANNESEDDESSWIQATDAPLALFRNPFPAASRNNFQIGMKLEAIDPFNQALFCVCTVVHVRGNRIKLRFDGFSAEYDFWRNADAKTIFPPGWCAATGRNIEPPAQWPINKKFNWNEYLKDPKVRF